MIRTIPSRSAAGYPGRFITVIRQTVPLTEASPPRHLQNRPRQLWLRTAATLAQGGVPALFSSALAAAGVRRLTLYRIRPEEAAARGASVPGVTLRLLSDQQIAEYLQLRADTSATEIGRRLRAGAQCMAAWRDGRLVAARWIETGRVKISYLGITVSLHPNVWYAYDAFTIPVERRRGVSGMLTAALVQRAMSLGATSVINTVLPENRGGRGLARRRSQRLGVLRSLRLGPWRVVGCWLPAGYLRAPAPPSTGHSV